MRRKRLEVFCGPVILSLGHSLSNACLLGRGPHKCFLVLSPLKQETRRVGSLVKVR